MQYDLTNEKISLTFPRLIQYISGSLYDGIGNPLNLTASFFTNIDGGKPDSVYGGSTPLVAGGP